MARTGFKRVSRDAPRMSMREVAVCAALAAVLIATLPFAPVRAEAAAGDGMRVTVTGPSSVAIGDSADYTVTVFNDDTVSATSVELQMLFPGPAVVKTPGPFACGTGPFFSCTVATLAPGASASATITFSPDGDTGESVSILALGSANEFGSEFTELPLTVPVDVDLLVDHSDPVVTFESPYSVPLVVREQGAAGQQAAGPVTVALSPAFGTDVTDGGVTVSAPAGSGWSCSNLTCTHPGPVPAGGTLPTITLAGTYLVDGNVQVDLTAASDGRTQNNSTMISIIGDAPDPDQPDLAVSVDDGGATFAAGDTGTHTITVENKGLGVATEGAALSISTGLVAPAFDGEGWSCTDESGWFQCSHAGAVAAGETLPALEVSGTVSDDGSGYVETNVYLDYTGGNSEDDEASIKTTVVPIVDLGVGWQVPTPLRVGSVGSVVITVTNHGVGTAQGEATVSLQGGPFGEDASVTGAGWSCDVSFGDASCTYVGDVGPGATYPTLTWSGSVGPVSGGKLSATAWVSHPDDLRWENDSIEIDAPVASPIDLTPEITGPVQLVAGQEASYTVRVRNLGTQPTSGDVSVTVYDPGGVDLFAASGTGWTCDQGYCTRSTAIPAGGAAPDITVSLVPRSSYDGQVTVYAAVDGGGDGDVDNNDATISTPFPPTANATIALDDDGATFMIGGSVTYSATVANPGSQAVTGPVTVFLYLDSDVTDAAASGDGWSCTPSNERSVGCEHPGPIPAAGQLPEITVTGHLGNAFGSSISLQGQVSADGDQRLDDNSADLTSPIGGESDLTVELESGPATFGQQVSVEATVSNVLATEAAGRVEVDLWSYELEAPAASGDGWLCGDAVDSMVSCARPGPVAAEASLPPIVLTGVVSRTSDAQIDVGAEVRGETDGNRDNDFASLPITVDVPVDWDIEIDDGGGSFPAGGEATTTVTVTNVGSGTASEPVTVDVYATSGGPTGTGDGWGCATDPDDVDHLVCLHAGAAAPGAALPGITVELQLPVSAGSVYTSAYVSSPEDGRTGNDGDFDSIDVVAVTDLTASVTDGGQAFAAGAQGTYTISVENPGTASSVGEITVDLSSSGPIDLATLSGSGWTCTTTPARCSTSATLAPSGSLPDITAVVDVTAGQGNSASMSATVSGGGDGFTSNNTGFDSTPIVSPDLVVSVSDDDATFTAPGTGTYEVVVGNRGGASTVSTSTVEFTTGGPLTVSAASGDGWTCSVAAASCTSDAVVAPGADFPTLTVTVDVVATEERVGSLTAAASGLDANPLNSIATESTPIVVPADLTISLEAGGPWFVGRESTLEATVTNVGTAAASGPVTVTFGTPFTGSGTGWECAEVGFGTECTHDGPVAPGASLPLLTATETPVLESAPEVTRSATVHDPSDGSPDNDAADIDIPVSIAVDLTVEMDYDEPFSVGQPDSVDVTVRNLGVEATDGPVTVTIDQDSSGIPQVAGAGWDCLTLFGSTECTHDGPIPAGGTLPPITTSFSVNIHNHPKTVVSARVAHADDVQPANDVVVAEIPTLGVDLEIAIDDLGDGAAEIGDTRTWQIDMENIGGLAPPGAATVTVTPGPGLLQNTVTGTGWSCAPIDGTDAIGCSTTGPIPASGAYSPLVLSSYVGGDAFPNTNVIARVGVPAESIVDARNEAIAGLEVVGASDLVVGVGAPEVVDVGDPVTATVLVSNQGQIPTAGVTTVDLSLPLGVAEPAGTGDGWQCAPADGDAVLRCESAESVAAAAAFPVIEMTMDVELAAYPQLTFNVSLDNANDGNITNNVGSAVTKVQGIPHLVAGQSGPDLVAGGVVSRTIEVTNIGTEAADAPTIVTSLVSGTDEGLSTVGAIGVGWDCAVTDGKATCTHPGPVPAEGALPPLIVNVAASADRYDVGRICRPVDTGSRLLRGCSPVGVGGPVALSYGVANTAQVLPGDLVAGGGPVVAQPVDLTVSTSVSEAHPGSIATLTSVVSNQGVDPATGPIRVVQRLECGLRADLAPGEQGSCLPGTDTLPGLDPVGVGGEGWTCDLLAGIASCTHPGPLAPGASLPPIEAQVAIGVDLLGANLWIAPEVSGPGDTNLNNDRPESGSAVRLRPPDRPDLAVDLGSDQYTVGINGLLGVSVTNTSGATLSGPTTAFVDVGAGFDVPAIQAGDWSCTQTGTVVGCTLDEAIAPGAVSGFNLVVTPLAAGVPQQAVQATITNAADVVAANNVRTRTQKIFAQPEPTAVAGVDRTVARVNQTLHFNGSFSANTFPDTTFRWDFGDGITQFGANVDHEYQRPGTYTAVLRVSNGPRTSRDTLRVVVVPDEPLVADAGDDRVGEEQAIIAFDGGASRPFAAIESFEWDFGDGTPTVVGRHAQHIYAAPGDHEATLTIRSGAEVATDTVKVDVREQGAGGPSGGLAVTVLDEAGTPIRATDVALLDAAGVRYSARTGDDGVASLRNLPDGRFSVYAYKLGYLPVIGRGRVVGGLGATSVTMKPGQVGEATLEHRRLTLEEIIAAGIDVNDPANQNIISFNVALGFEVFPNEGEGEMLEFGAYVNGDGELIDVPIDWVCNETQTECVYEDDEGLEVDVEVEEVEDQPVLVFLVIPGKASWLKEFFQVSMTVANLAPKGFAFTEGAATLDVPAGLTLAPTSDPQSFTIDVPDIPSGKTASARWIVRGDRPGEYDLGAAYTGVLDPIGSPVLLQARSKNPLKVWGINAVNIRVRAQQQVRKGKPYLVRIGIENISDTPIYNLAIQLDDLQGDAAFEYAPWTDRTPGTDVVEPTTTTWFDIWLIPGFDGQLVSCNLCARTVTTAGGRAAAVPAAVDDGELDTGDLASSIAGLGGGSTVGADPTTMEIVPRDDEGLTATALVDGDQHHVSWSAVDGADGYEVYAEGGDEALAELSADTTSVDLPASSSIPAYVVATIVDDEVRELRHPLAVVTDGGTTTTSTSTTMPGSTTSTTGTGSTTSTTGTGSTTSTTSTGSTTSTTGTGSTTSTTSPGSTTSTTSTGSTTSTTGTGSTTSTTSPGSTTSTTSTGSTTSTTSTGSTTSTTSTGSTTSTTGTGSTTSTTGTGSTTSTTSTGSTTSTTGTGSTTSTTVPDLAKLPDPPGTPPPFSKGLSGVPHTVTVGQLLRLLLEKGTTAYRAVFYSTPVVLAEGGAAESVDVRIPSDAAPGTHTLVLWAVVDGEVHVSGQEILVVGDEATTTTASSSPAPDVEPGTLPRTGSDTWGPLRLSIQLTVVGLFLVFVSRRRRRRLGARSGS